MPRPDVIDTQELIDRVLTPPRARASIEAGKVKPFYMVYRKDMDRLPIDTFLVQTQEGTGGRVPVLVGRIVKPNDPTKYRAKELTPAQRLVYVCWREGRAVRSLAEARQMICRHIILPSDPRHELVAAFKIACDARRALNAKPVPHKPDLLLRALATTE